MLDEWEARAARDEPVDLMAEMLRLTLVTAGSSRAQAPACPHSAGSA